MRTARKMACNYTPQESNTHATTFAFTSLRRDAIMDSLTALFFDVQGLRLLAATVESYCVQRPMMSMQQIMARRNGNFVAAVLSPQDFFKGIMFFKGRVVFAMQRLHSLYTGSCEMTGEDSQLSEQLLAVLRRWEVCAGIFISDDALASRLSELIAALDDVITKLKKVILKLRNDEKLISTDNSAVVVIRKAATDAEGAHIREKTLGTNWHKNYRMCHAAGHFLGLIRRLGLNVNAILSTTGLRCMMAAFSLIIVLPLAQILFGFHAMRGANLSMFLEGNRTALIPSYVDGNLICMLFSAMQFLVGLGMGFVFLVILSTTTSNLAYAAVLQALFMQGAMSLRSNGQNTFDANNVDDDEEDSDDNENSMSLASQSPMNFEKDSQPTPPPSLNWRYEGYGGTLCGGTHDGGLLEEYQHDHVNRYQAFAASLVNLPVEGHGSKAAFADIVESEEEMQLSSLGLDKDVDIDDGGASDKDCSIRYRCMQAEREIQMLFTDAPSGVADKYKEFSPCAHADRSANICRHLTENVQDCVCPLIIVEYVPHTVALRGSFKPGDTKELYPVVYCSMSALELLQYRWMVDLAGKDFKNLFELHRNLKRPSNKNRVKGGNKVTSLPALPQKSRGKNQGPLVLVPAPPSKERNHSEKRHMEKVDDMRCLFESGVEELLTMQLLQKSLCFEVYAMSSSNVALPSSFCEPGQFSLSASMDKKYLVLLFIREVNGEPRETSRKLIGDTVSREEFDPNIRLMDHSPMGHAFSPHLQKRPSTTSSGTVSILNACGSLMQDVVEDDCESHSSVPRGRRVRTAATGYRRRKRRSTLRGYPSPISAERGHAVDYVTAQQLREKLSSLLAVFGVELSSRVPEKFLINFVALMIFVNRVLKRYKRVNCRVDAENMFILLELRALENAPPLKVGGRRGDEENSSSSLDFSPIDNGSRVHNTHDLGISSILSANLLEYLRVCDATIHLTANGCTLRFPYTTQERLALMEEAGTLQLSTLRGLSLFGVTATNALTEDAAAQSSGQMIHLHQYAAAEEAFSEAVRKTKFGSTWRAEEGSLGAPSNSKIDHGLKGDQNSSIAGFLGIPLVQSFEELSGSSSGSVTRLPQVFGGGQSKTTEPNAHPPPLGLAHDSKSGYDANQTTPNEWPSVSALARVDNMFCKSWARSGSDAMATSTSCNSPFGGKAGGNYKRYLHVFLYMKEHRQDFLQSLWGRGHSATVVSDPVVMYRYLSIGMNAFDVLFVEWSEKLVTPDIRDLIVSHTVKQTTILYLLTDDAHSLPVPPGTPEGAVLRMQEIGEIFTNFTIGQNLSHYIRQRRLKHEMIQIRWRKSYQIVRQIGGGAFGDVYEVYLFVSRGRLAMKRLFLNGASHRFLEQLNREVSIMSQMDHPNIVSFSHSSMEDNAYCIFMELCDGTLDQRLHRGLSATESNQMNKPPLPRLSNGASFPIQPVGTIGDRPDVTHDEFSKIPEPLTAREIVLLLRDVASGIAYLHSQGIVHRDIKPCNILFSGGVAKIGDFGSAAEECATKPLVNMKGTLAYMSPEVLLGEPYGRPCDMWSFGCLLAEVLGLRLGHLQGLHFPALVELYTSIPKDGSLPITVANHKGGKLQHHFGTTTAQMILGAMKNAYNDARGKQGEGSVQRRLVTSSSPKEKLSSSSRNESFESKLLSSMTCDSSRAITYITTNNTTFFGSEKAELPESLVELLENLFCRDPRKRMTAEEVLHHPVTWDVEWMEMVIRAVEEICPLDADDASVDASHAGENSAEREEDLDLSISST
ncbi:protein kinase, putative [Trypanosoma cruzi marinkellei]|uniref:non-specific serine/threonine protein kinase n=1 Tax=Trypanosoma cruzi marinkellei TaxID=85056 RepID=K2N6B6_TRYCR|nr:protein kinase, putative [Trypanosoma cruzi marinkellei]